MQFILYIYDYVFAQQLLLCCNEVSFEISRIAYLIIYYPRYNWTYFICALHAYPNSFDKYTIVIA